MLRILLCDGQSLTRLGMRAALASYHDLDLVGEVVTGERAIMAVDQLKPDVVIADVGLPGLGAADLTRHIVNGVGSPTDTPGTRDPHNKPPVLALVREIDDAALQAVRAGAAGVVLKTCDVDELVRAIRVVVDGGGFLEPSVARYVLNHMAGRVVSTAGIVALESLTKREQEVLELVADGLSNQEIALNLYVGEPTVKYHVSQMLRKLNLRDRLQAAAFAHRNGLTQP